MVTNASKIPARACRSAALWLAIAISAALLANTPTLARDASGKGSPVYGAGHTTPHGVKPGQGISGKPENHGKGGTAHVPGPKGGSHDDETHDHTSGGHDSGTEHVPGGKGGSGGHEDESGHEDGEEHEEGHTPGPKPGGGHSSGGS